jgi:hypothetical protein
MLFYFILFVFLVAGKDLMSDRGVSFQDQDQLLPSQLHPSQRQVNSSQNLTGSSGSLATGLASPRLTTSRDLESTKTHPVTAAWSASLAVGEVRSRSVSVGARTDGALERDRDPVSNPSSGRSSPRSRSGQDSEWGIIGVPLHALVECMRSEPPVFVSELLIPTFADIRTAALARLPLDGYAGLFLNFLPSDVWAQRLLSGVVSDEDSLSPRKDREKKTKKQKSTDAASASRSAAGGVNATLYYQQWPSAGGGSGSSGSVGNSPVLAHSFVYRKARSPRSSDLPETTGGDAEQVVEPDALSNSAEICAQLLFSLLDSAATYGAVEGSRVMIEFWNSFVQPLYRLVPNVDGLVPLSQVLVHAGKIRELRSSSSRGNVKGQGTSHQLDEMFLLMHPLMQMAVISAAEMWIASNGAAFLALQSLLTEHILASAPLSPASESEDEGAAPAAEPYALSPDVPRRNVVQKRRADPTTSSMPSPTSSQSLSTGSGMRVGRKRSSDSASAAADQKLRFSTLDTSLEECQVPALAAFIIAAALRATHAPLAQFTATLPSQALRVLQQLLWLPGALDNSSACALAVLRELYLRSVAQHMDFHTIVRPPAQPVFWLFHATSMLRDFRSIGLRETSQPIQKILFKVLDSAFGSVKLYIDRQLAAARANADGEAAPSVRFVEVNGSTFQLLVEVALHVGATKHFSVKSRQHLAKTIETYIGFAEFDECLMRFILSYVRVFVNSLGAYLPFRKRQYTFQPEVSFIGSAGIEGPLGDALPLLPVGHLLDTVRMFAGILASRGSHQMILSFLSSLLKGTPLGFSVKLVRFLFSSASQISNVSAESGQKRLRKKPARFGTTMRSSVTLSHRSASAGGLGAASVSKAPAAEPASMTCSDGAVPFSTGLQNPSAVVAAAVGDSPLSPRSEIIMPSSSRQCEEVVLEISDQPIQLPTSEQPIQLSTSEPLPSISSRDALPPNSQSTRLSKSAHVADVDAEAAPAATVTLGGDETPELMCRVDLMGVFLPRLMREIDQILNECLASRPSAGTGFAELLESLCLLIEYAWKVSPVSPSLYDFSVHGVLLRGLTSPELSLIVLSKFSSLMKRGYLLPLDDESGAVVYEKLSRWIAVMEAVKLAAEALFEKDTAEPAQLRALVDWTVANAALPDLLLSRLSEKEVALHDLNGLLAKRMKRHFVSNLELLLLLLNYPHTSAADRVSCLCALCASIMEDFHVLLQQKRSDQAVAAAAAASSPSSTERLNRRPKNAARLQLLGGPLPVLAAQADVEAKGASDSVASADQSSPPAGMSDVPAVTPAPSAVAESPSAATGPAFSNSRLIRMTSIRTQMKAKSVTSLNAKSAVHGGIDREDSANLVVHGILAKLKTLLSYIDHDENQRTSSCALRCVSALALPQIFTQLIEMTPAVAINVAEIVIKHLVSVFAVSRRVQVEPWMLSLALLEWLRLPLPYLEHPAVGDALVQLFESTLFRSTGLPAQAFRDCKPMYTSTTDRYLSYIQFLYASMPLSYSPEVLAAHPTIPYVEHLLAFLAFELGLPDGAPLYPVDGDYPEDPLKSWWFVVNGRSIVAVPVDKSQRDALVFSGLGAYQFVLNDTDRELASPVYLPLPLASALWGPGAPRVTALRITDGNVASFLRYMRQLQKLPSRHLAKVAVLFVPSGSEKEDEILGVDGASPQLDAFLARLSPPRHLSTYSGYVAGLDTRDLVDGRYFHGAVHACTEVAYHVVHMMNPPQVKSREDVILMRKRHVGNDHVSVIWSEHQVDFHNETIMSKFNDIHIALFPLDSKGRIFRTKLFSKKQATVGGAGSAVFDFAPLSDGMLVLASALPALVDQTALFAHMDFRMRSDAYVLPYTARCRVIEDLRQRHAENTEHTDVVYFSSQHYGAFCTDRLIKRFAFGEHLLSSSNQRGLVSHLQRVQRLSLRSNLLSTLPEDITLCSSLEYVDLSYCSLKQVPAVLSELAQLRVLDVSCNALTDVDDSTLLALRSLRRLLMHGNEIRVVRSSLLARLCALELCTLGENPCVLPVGAELPSPSVSYALPSLFGLCFTAALRHSMKVPRDCTPPAVQPCSMCELSLVVPMSTVLAPVRAGSFVVLVRYIACGSSCAADLEAQLPSLQGLLSGALQLYPK